MIMLRLQAAAVQLIEPHRMQACDPSLSPMGMSHKSYLHEPSDINATPVWLHVDC